MAGSGSRRGTIVDGGENGRAQDGRPDKPRRAYTCWFERQAEKRRDDHCRQRGLNEMPLSRIVVAADAHVHFSRVARGDQVVGHGDGRQQNDDDQRERNELDTAIFSSMRRSPQPGDDHPRGQNSPAEIERQFHSFCRFYSRGRRAPDTRTRGAPAPRTRSSRKGRDERGTGPATATFESRVDSAGGAFHNEIPSTRWKSCRITGKPLLVVTPALD